MGRETSDGEKLHCERSVAISTGSAMTPVPVEPGEDWDSHCVTPQWEVFGLAMGREASDGEKFHCERSVAISTGSAMTPVPVEPGEDWDGHCVPSQLEVFGLAMRGDGRGGEKFHCERSVAISTGSAMTPVPGESGGDWDCDCVPSQWEVPGQIIFNPYPENFV